METSSDELHEEARVLKLKFRREEHLLNFMYDLPQDDRELKGENTARGLPRDQIVKNC